MVDISEKESTVRTAIAEGYIKLRKETIERIKNGKIEKGDVISVAKIAAILAAKKTSELLPLCHPIPLESVNVDVELDERREEVKVVAEIKAHYKTGVEMEALTAVSVALLTIWDMVKKYEKDEKGQYPETVIHDIRVLRKTKTSS